MDSPMRRWSCVKSRHPTVMQCLRSGRHLNMTSSFDWKSTHDWKMWKVWEMERIRKTVVRKGSERGFENRMLYSSSSITDSHLIQQQIRTPVYEVFVVSLNSYYFSDILLPLLATLLVLVVLFIVESGRPSILCWNHQKEDGGDSKTFCWQIER